ncbi:MAG: hypothetical protein J1F18_15090, partial [Lachnospiraceae bacterium]|nr:hypothetical protein [Lachnospiraceae bacterium]
WYTVMENPIFVMSLSGTLVFLLYKIIYPFARKYFRPTWRYIFLKVALAFYLIPIPLLLNWIRCAVKTFAESNSNNTNILISFDNFADSIVVSTNSILASPYFIALLSISVCFGIVSFLLICFQTYRYIKEKRMCLQFGYDLPQDRFQNDLAAINLRQNVKFMASQKARTPFVIGVLKPVIILPTQLLDEDDETISIYIRHELSHIKKHDMVYRLLSLITVCVHWYNPFCHWCRKELIVVSEICCDHEVLETIQKSQRKQYYNALVSMTVSLRGESQSGFLSAFVDKNNSELKRRILELEIIDTSKLKLLAVFSCVAVVLTGAIGALAYAPYPIQTDPALNKNNTLSVFDPDTSFIDDFVQPPNTAQTDPEQDSNNHLTILNPDVSSTEGYDQITSEATQANTEQDLNDNFTIIDTDAASTDDFGQLPNTVPENTKQDSNNHLTILDPNTSSTDEFIYPLPFACYFADANGTVHEVNLEQGNQSCVHELVSGTIVEHIKTSESGCTMTYYQGKRCEVCGFLERGTCVYQNDSERCNHTFMNTKGGE